jgi:hypothetical protein
MTTRATAEGIFVALLPQRGQALVEALREAARQFLGESAPAGWALEYGLIAAPAGAVAFRLVHEAEAFGWRESGFGHLARLASVAGPGRCFGLALERQGSGPPAWADGIAFDGGRRLTEEQAAAEPAEILAWFGEQLALSENEVLALLGACDLRVELGGGERGPDEIDEILARARREFERYRALRDARERGQGE